MKSPSASSEDDGSANLIAGRRAGAAAEGDVSRHGGHPGLDTGGGRRTASHRSGGEAVAAAVARRRGRRPRGGGGVRPAPFGGGCATPAAAAADPGGAEAARQERLLLLPRRVILHDHQVKSVRMVNLNTMFRAMITNHGWPNRIHIRNLNQDILFFWKRECSSYQKEGGRHELIFLCRIPNGQYEDLSSACNP